MKGVAGTTLVVVGHGTLALTSGYVLRLLNQRSLLNIGCGAFLTYGGFLLLGLCGLVRYLYPSTLAQRCYRELSSATHAVGLVSLSLVSLELHDLIEIPPTTVPIHFILLASFTAVRFLFGAWFEDVMTKLLWCTSALLIFYTGLRAHHWMEMVGSTFLASSFFTFYFNRTFTDNRVIFGISDLVWYLLLLNVSLLLLGHSFFSESAVHFDP